MKKVLVPDTIISEQNNLTVESTLPDLYTTIQELRSFIEVFQKHGFTGVPSTKHLTVHSHVYPIPQNTFYKERQVPHIKFMGRWLDRLGFSPARNIRIIGLKELLIICPETPAPDKKEEEVATDNLITMEQLFAAG